MGLHDQAALYDMVGQEAAKPIEPPRRDSPRDKKQPPNRLPEGAPQDGPPSGKPQSAPDLSPEVAQRYVARRGYANYWYNLQHQQRIWSGYQKRTVHWAAPWQIHGTLPDGKPFELTVDAERGEAIFPWGKSGALFREDPANQLSPPRSGGLLLTLHLWQRLLDKGLGRYGEVYYLGQMPMCVQGPWTDCLVGIHAGLETHFYFDPESSDLVGITMFPGDETDPCEMQFTDFASVGHQHLPQTWRIRHGDHEFAQLRIHQWQRGSDEAAPATEPSAVEGH